MSEDSADRAPSPPQPRNDDNQGQIGVVNQMNPLANNPPPPPAFVGIARRIVAIPSGNDIVAVLSNISSTYNQAIYILDTMGLASSASFTEFPSLKEVDYSNAQGHRLANISYLSGWFQQKELNITGLSELFSRPNGVLHAAVVGIPNGVSVARSLIARVGVEVKVIFICGPGSAIQPDIAGAPPARIDIPAAPQADAGAPAIAINLPPQPVAQRILTVNNGDDVVSVLSSIPHSHRQPIYILGGWGHSTQFMLTRIPSEQQRSYSKKREVHFMSGWFQPIAMDNTGSGWRGAFSRPNGVLHVSIEDIPAGAYLANSLIAFETIEVLILFICRPGSVIEEADAPPSPFLPPPQ